MIVCHCCRVTREEVEASVERLDEPTYQSVLMDTGACRGCGSCAPNIVSIIATMGAFQTKEETSGEE